MATEVLMPQMGESIAEGTLTRWFKQPGDVIQRDEPLFEISTDKVDAEVPAPADGVLEKIIVEEGATVEVNTVVAILGSGDGAAAAPAAEAAPVAEATPPQPAAEPAPVAEPVAASEPAPTATPAASGSLTDVPMPQMGESIAEGTLTRWFKQAGDTVERDEPLFEISTDKVDAEVPAPASGVLAEIIVEEGATVEVNTVVARIGEAGAASAAPPAPTPAAAPEPVAAAPAAAPTPAPVPPTPAPAPAPAPAAVPAAAPAAPAPVAAAAVANGSHKVRSSPLVRRIARDNGISDLSVIPGTGAGGRVTKDDILGFIASGTSAPATPAAPAAVPAAPAAVPAAPAASPAAAAPAPALAPQGLPRGGSQVEKMSVMRRKIAEHMVDSRRTSAHVHSVFEADMTSIAQMRQKWKNDFISRNGTKLTFMPFFLKACCDALRQFPHVNASIDGDDILLHNDVNIGIAVALDNGLIVPVVKNVQDMSIAGIQKSVSDVAHRARNKQLLPDEVAGGTFTITNPGQFGGLFGIPIINQPQVAILGIGGIIKRPVVVDGDKIAIRDMLYMCLSYDHRLVDGALADQFMSHVKHTLENFDESAIG